MGRPPIGKKAMSSTERSRRRRAGGAATKPATKPASAEAESEIAALRDENHAFRVELAARDHVIKTRDGGGLTKAQFGMFEMALHPDNAASKETREKCFRLFRHLRYVLCNEAELPAMDPQKFALPFRKLWERRQQVIKAAKKDAKRRGQHKPKPKAPKHLRK